MDSLIVPLATLQGSFVPVKRRKSFAGVIAGDIGMNDNKGV